MQRYSNLLWASRQLMNRSVFSVIEHLTDLCFFIKGASIHSMSTWTNQPATPSLSVHSSLISLLTLLFVILGSPPLVWLPACGVVPQGLVEFPKEARGCLNANKKKFFLNNYNCTNHLYPENEQTQCK